MPWYVCVIPKAVGKKGVSAGNIYKQVAALEKISKDALPTPSLQKSVLSSLKTWPLKETHISSSGWLHSLNCHDLSSAEITGGTNGQPHP